uniref:trimeric intracellular cation channel family protein n=1 Tax=Litoreibacter halocynthiae TaxID=1242689 RepID=UPI0024918DF7
FVFIACLTAVGGGTVRDVLLARPVFWVQEPTYILVASIAAFEVFFTSHLMKSRYRSILWIDAFALAVAVPAGVAAAVSMQATWPIVLIMGVSTGCFGGLMRDVVCNEVPLVLKQGELYVTCAFTGAGAAVGLLALGQPLSIALLGCAVVTLALRTGSIAFGWSLPVYKSRPPRA